MLNKKIMKQAISAKQKRGRPPTGIRPMIGFRADFQLRQAIEKWAKSQADKPKLSDAIRRLVEIALTDTSKARGQSPSGAARAKSLATRAVEGIIDPSVPSEERAQRRRRLTKGPAEFREDRVDQPTRSEQKAKRK
jgi:hypothetical protein